MHLKELLENIYEGKLDPARDYLAIDAINCDSRKVGKNSLFVALKGHQYDGADFIDDAIDKGARVIVTDENVEPRINGNLYHLQVKEPNQFLRNIAKRFYGNPSSEVHTMGITGTNGKTTIAYLIESILHEAEKSCSVIGTINYRIGEKVLPAINTTPGLLENQRLLSDIVNDGVEYCIMEVSSHALVQGRVDLINYKTAVFTNLTSDHLDYHKTRDNYFAAKTKLFTNLAPDALSVINADDDYGQRLFSKTESQILTYGIRNNAEVMARDIEFDISGTRFKLCSQEGEIVIRTKLVGEYNISNILAAASVGLSQKISLEKIKKGVEQLNLVPGRLESVDCQQNFSIFIDYAHTQDALENVLRAIRNVSDARMIVVFGCGGDRDVTKRPAMGTVASHLADFSIVTSDNPRSEDPEAIIQQIIEGFEDDNYKVVVDREEAIKIALNMAQKDDIVLIVGKGHETYQVFKDRTIKFNERQIISQFLRC